MSDADKYETAWLAAYHLSNWAIEGIVGSRGPVNLESLYKELMYKREELNRVELRDTLRDEVLPFMSDQLLNEAADSTTRIKRE